MKAPGHAALLGHPSSLPTQLGRRYPHRRTRLSFCMAKSLLLTVCRDNEPPGICSHMDCYRLQCSKLAFSSKAFLKPKTPALKRDSACSRVPKPAAGSLVTAPDDKGRRRRFLAANTAALHHFPFFLQRQHPQPEGSLCPRLPLSDPSAPRAHSRSPGHLRLMDAAVVEHEIHRGKLLPRLLGFQVELHHSLVPWERARQRRASERTRRTARRSAQGWKDLGNNSTHPSQRTKPPHLEMQGGCPPTPNWTPNGSARRRHSTKPLQLTAAVSTEAAALGVCQWCWRGT